MFHQMPALLALLIFIIIAFGGYMPLQLAEILFGVSLTIKSIIIFLLPVIIFSLLYKAVANLAKDASRIILVILGGVIISNFLTTFLSQVIGIIIYGFDLSLAIPNENDALKGHILFALPNLIPNHYAMFSGIITGILSARITPKKTENICLLLEVMTTQLLKIITFMIPLFVTGFVVKLQYDGVITQILKNYTMIFMIIAFSQFGYVTFVYFVLEKFNLSNSVISIKNMLPAAMSAFSRMSSAASMPLTIIGTEKNAQNKDLVHTVIPATVNIHLVGDCIAILCFAYAILKNYNLPQPDIYTYIIFTFYFVLAKFSVAVIPGGGILVMLPILDKYLGFNTEMLSLITALYILFDPFITSANVLGNETFARIIDKLNLKKQL